MAPGGRYKASLEALEGKAQDAVFFGKRPESTQSSDLDLGGRRDLHCQVPGHSWLRL
jgi:hypothetical protein